MAQQAYALPVRVGAASRAVGMAVAVAAPPMRKGGQSPVALARAVQLCIAGRCILNGDQTVILSSRAQSSC